MESSPNFYAFLFFLLFEPRVSLFLCWFFWEGWGHCLLVGWLVFWFYRGLVNSSFSSAHPKFKLLSWLLVEPVPSGFTEHREPRRD